MAAAAMPLEELERWLQARANRHAAATGLPMLDGYVTAIVAGPESISPLDWICPLLAIDADAFNHGDTPEFAAISAVALRHNEISQILSTTPRQYEPMHRRKPSGDVDPRPWCQGLPTLRVYGSSEVLALRVSDIDSEPLLLRIEQGKGRRKDRFAMLSPLLLELLRDCRIVQPSDTQRRLCRR